MGAIHLVPRRNNRHALEDVINVLIDLERQMERGVVALIPRIHACQRQVSRTIVGS